MALYLVQDADRPMYVKADSMGEAVKRWQEVVAIENEMAFNEVEEPQGISYIVPDNEFLE